jgi:23S rRNA A2030 N6-methylase RlmJ
VGNIHFARIGDVWKHGPLVEVITAMRPRLYAETHAGSAVYSLSPSPERDYGARRLLDAASQSSAVAASTYLGLLREAAGRNPPEFPGSPALAMSVLGDDARYLFCDVDKESLENIRRWAGDRAVSDVATVEADGVMTTRDVMGELPDADAVRSLVFIDPYEPFDDVDATGLTPFELLCGLGVRGVPALLWYGFDGEDDRREIRARFSSVGMRVTARVSCGRPRSSLPICGSPTFPSTAGTSAAAWLG